MRTILPNIWMLLLRLVILSLFIYLYQFPIDKIQSGEYKENARIFILGFVAISMFPAYLIWTLLKVMWIKISEDEGMISFHYLYKTVCISAHDIDGYFSTIQKTKVKDYDGLLLKLKSGKVVEITEYNIRSTNPVRKFLNIYKVPLRGNKNSWFPLTRKL